MIPAPLYELLPYGYVFSGILAFTGLETILGKVCGLLLIIVGVMVYQARKRYRHRAVDEAGAKTHRSSLRPSTETSRRNTADPISRASRRNTADPISQTSRRGITDPISQASRRGITDPISQMSQPDPISPVWMDSEQAFEEGVASEGCGDYQAAFQWYRQAADQGHAPAQVNFGALYAEGHGIPQDLQTAFQWYRKAANQGYAPAQFNLGVMYIAGQGGIAKDYTMAYVWFSRATIQGDEDARQAQKKLATRLTEDQKAQARQLLMQTGPLIEKISSRSASADPSRRSVASAPRI